METALAHVLNVEEWNLHKGLVFCHDNVSTAGKVLYLPWYMAMFLKPPKPVSGIVQEDFSTLKPEPYNQPESARE